jgi:NADH-quinone oxidoreductase subunit N
MDLHFSLIMPEIIVTATAVLVMAIEAFTRKSLKAWPSGIVSMLGLAAAAFFTIDLYGWDGPRKAFYNMIVIDDLRLSFTLVFIVVAILTVLLSIVWVKWEDLPAGEFHTLLLFATVGMMLMASGLDLVMIFLGLEILSIATYVMAGFRRTDLRSNESSLKYFILGSFSSGFLLYGIALIYGATGTATGLAGTTNIEEIAIRLQSPLYTPLLFAGAAMLFIGFAFKIALAPFHVWTPDVYEGAPTPVTAFMAAGPKAAGFASFLRVFLFGFPIALSAGAAADLHTAWLSAMSLLAVLTMTIGNVVAIVQSNVKRMLAYSSIAHAGYALVGFVAAGATSDIQRRDTAIAAVIFYLLAYAVMNIGAFAVVTLIARSGDRLTRFEDYNGIGFRAPVLAFLLTLFLLSLLGMPLTAGFIGKVAVFGAALNEGYTGLVIVGVLNTAISVYYYLRLIVLMFFREVSAPWSPPAIPGSATIALVVTAIAVLYMGIFPGTLLDVLNRTPPEAVSAQVIDQK